MSTVPPTNDAPVDMPRIATVILAAGQGTRMKSRLPKVLHPVGGIPMVERSVNAALPGDMLPVVVIAADAHAVRSRLAGKAQFAVQSPPSGTAHAVMQARALLDTPAQPFERPFDLITVYYADMPLLQTETLYSLLTLQQNTPDAVCSMLTVIQDDPRGFGRVVRRTDGTVHAVIEEKQCTPEQRAIRELNVGVYIFRTDFLWAALDRVQPQANGEYYLTDLVQIAVADGKKVAALIVEDTDQVIGVNTRVHLADAETALRARTNHRWMLEGVTIRDPHTTYIAETVVIGQDTIILPNTTLEGNTRIGASCVLGPNTVISDSQIADSCTINGSVVEQSTLEADVEVGPFAHIRPKSYLERGVHMGNFGEIKASRLGAGTRIGHFSYIGDAQVGADVNIGAGTITANYDGVNKHKTVIGDRVFIGSDTIIVAPRSIADDARTAAGSVVTKDVPSHHIAIGLPARMRALRAEVAEQDDTQA